MIRYGLASLGMLGCDPVRLGKDFKVIKNSNQEVYMEITTKQNGSNETKKPQEILAEVFADMQYGKLLEHNEIEKIIGCSRNYEQNKYNRIIQSTKCILLHQYSRTLQSEHGKGYSVVDPDNVVHSALGHYKRGLNEIAKGKDTLDFAPINDMSDEGRKIYTRVYDRSVILHASLQSAVCEVKLLSAKRPNPLLGGLRNNDKDIRKNDKDDNNNRPDNRL